MMRENSVTDTQGHFSKLTESLSNLLQIGDQLIPLLELLTFVDFMAPIVLVRFNLWERTLRKD